MAERLPPTLKDEVLRSLVLGTFGQARWTQDSPIVPDVWIKFIHAAEDRARARAKRTREPDSNVDILLTPWTGASAGKIAHRIRQVLGVDRARSARVATSTSRVVASLDFASLIRIIVPMTGWWREHQVDKEMLCSPREHLKAERAQGGARLEYLRFATLVSFIAAMEDAYTREEIARLNSIAHRLGARPEDGHHAVDLNTPTISKDLDFLFDFYPVHFAQVFDDESDPDTRIWLVNLNRPASQAMFDARKTVKADAAQRVFDTEGKGITVAIIDNGIDAEHTAFIDIDEPRVVQRLNSSHTKFRRSELGWSSRIRATYDFSMLRDLLSDAAFDAQVAEQELKQKMPSRSSEELSKGIKYLAQRAEEARGLDWSVVAPLIQIPHDGSYTPPTDDHGTHVAGILGANFVESDIGRPVVGICQRISMYDLRVFGKDGGDEFAILAAIEFVGWINRDRDNPVIHGVNLSLALRHDFDSFACGRTPICDACNQLVGSGVVVVAAAGNMGFDGNSKQSMGNGYRTVSITDPGNAEDVITVGSTHRRDPHAYGVSYFSSRGPTGDGRRKPDILAPGEKITSTVLGNMSKRLDGTSMAAPHVTGAAALLMARYPELIGQPRKIKKILMETATDLGRLPEFQGAGLVDILRALQAV